MRNPADRLAGRRVDHIDRSAACRVKPFIVDQQAGVGVVVGFHGNNSMFKKIMGKIRSTSRRTLDHLRAAQLRDPSSDHTQFREHFVGVLPQRRRYRELVADT